MSSNSSRINTLTVSQLEFSLCSLKERGMDFDLTAETQIATILGTVIAIVGLILAIRWQRSKKKGGGRQNQDVSGSQNVAQKIDTTITINIGNNVTNETITSLLCQLSSIINTQKQPSISLHIDDDVNDSINQLIECLDNRCGITKILLLAHKIAKKRKDQEIIAWLEAEMDGYEEIDKEISYRIIEAHFQMRAGSNNYPLPHRFFSFKSAEEVERMIIEYNSTSTGQSPYLLMNIPTPDTVKDFFESQRSEIPDLHIPQMITLFTEIEKYKAILTGIKKRIRNYVLEIQ